MLEFYQAYTDYRGVMDLTQQLIEQAAKDVTGGTKAKWGEDEIDWAGSNWRRMTMREAIIQYWPEAAGAKPEMSDFASAEGGRESGEALQLGARACGLRSQRAGGKNDRRICSKPRRKST